MPTRAYLYDATARDHEVKLDKEVIASLHDQQVLWIDITAPETGEIAHLALLMHLRRDTLVGLHDDNRRPRFDNYSQYYQFNIDTLEEAGGKYASSKIHFILATNIVATIHAQPAAMLVNFDEQVKGDSNLGLLDAPSFLAAMLDWHITGFFRIIEDVEVRIDRLDALAMQPRRKRNLLQDLAVLRGRVGTIRRVLTPHREVYAAIARPDFQPGVNAESLSSFLLLNDRLTRVIDASENARELLVGSYDIFMTQTAMRTNEVVKVLTLVSAVLYPASLIVSISALVLHAPVYSIGPIGFWVMLGLIVAVSMGTLTVARWRKWL